MLSMPGPTMYKRKRDDVVGPSNYPMVRAPAYKRPRRTQSVRVGASSRSKIGELKNFDHNIVTNAGAGGGTTDIEPTLCDIPEGTGENERVGRRVLVKSIQLKGSVGADAIPDDASVPIRWGLYLDRQTNGAAATFADLFTVVSGIEYGAMRNLDNSGRFHIICDRQLTVGRGFSTASKQDYVPVNVYFRLNHVLEFSGGTGAISELTTNNFGLYIVQGDSVGSATASTNVRFRGTSRIRYQD